MSRSRPLRQNDHLFKVMTFDGMFTPQQCKHIIEMRSNYRSGKSLVYTDGHDRPDIRSSKTYILEEDAHTAWIYERVIRVSKKYCETAQFLVSNMENLQLLEYHTGGFFNWHFDVGYKAMSTRKFSMVALLSDPEDFRGGQLEFMMEEEPYRQVLYQGSASFFASFLLHRVTPVTRGPRYSLVAWFNGDAFR